MFISGIRRRIRHTLWNETTFLRWFVHVNTLIEHIFSSTCMLSMSYIMHKKKSQAEIEFSLKCELYSKEVRSQQTHAKMYYRNLLERCALFRILCGHSTTNEPFNWNNSDLEFNQCNQSCIRVGSGSLISILLLFINVWYWWHEAEKWTHTNTVSVDTMYELLRDRVFGCC